MAKRLAVEKELSELQALLARYPEGVSIETILSELGSKAGRRTLQRRLAILQQQGTVQTTGQSRAILYHLILPAKATNEASPGTIVPLSLRAQQLQNFIQQPPDRRPQVGYDPEFLRTYRPNRDAYLLPAEKAKLLAMGQTARQNEPAGTYARQILQRLLIDLSWNSSRLEGNTYSLLDTQRLLSLGQEADDKSAAESQMILNHKEAIEFLVSPAPEIGFNRYTITNLHAMLSYNLLPDPAASGRLRTFPVGITNSKYLPLGIPQQIEEFFDLFLSKAQQIEDPFEQAFFAMVHMPYLQPFEDVNKRVSRLAANIPLNAWNLAPLSFVDVPRDLYIQALLSVYERTSVDLLKDVFLWAYERSAIRYGEIRQTIGEPDPFRSKYREDIRRVVTEIVTNALTQPQAQQRIQSYTEQLPEADRTKFTEVVETELLSLHAGNFARYRILPSQFTAWQTAWNVAGKNI